MSNENIAQPELAGIEITGGLTRSSFILKGALAAGAVYGSTVVGPFVGQAFAAGGGDVDILNFALTLEYLESAFYKKALTLKLSSDVKKLATEIGDHENQHVAALKATIKKLGGTPVTAPGVTFPMHDEASFLKLAQVFEDTGVSAYNGAAPHIKSVEVLGAAGGIVQVEARHAAAIRLLNKTAPAPDAFDKSLQKAQVLSAVKPFIKA
jgi:rubrerythrin